MSANLSYRLQPPSRWFTAFCFAVACACLALAYWQHQRVALKQARQDAAAAWRTSSPLTTADLHSTSELLWRPAVIVGTYAADAQFLIDNRIHNSRVGFHVITPLRIANDRWLLVNRGWLPLAASRDAVRAPAPADNEVTLHGTLAPDDTGAFELGEDTGANNIWQWLLIERWEDRSGKIAVPAVLLASTDDELVTVDRQPDYRADISRGYRLQWLAFAIIAIGGWLAVSLRCTST